MINLCNHDHTMHHDGQLDITGNPEGTITFTHPDGRQVHSPARHRPDTTRPKPTTLTKHGVRRETERRNERGSKGQAGSESQTQFAGRC
jgi:hypothetical protein